LTYAPDSKTRRVPIAQLAESSWPKYISGANKTVELKAAAEAAKKAEEEEDVTQIILPKKKVLPDSENATTSSKTGTDGASAASSADKPQPDALTSKDTETSKEEGTEVGDDDWEEECVVGEGRTCGIGAHGKGGSKKRSEPENKADVFSVIMTLHGTGISALSQVHTDRLTQSIALTPTLSD
jgi:hypothetical protein